MCLNKPAGSPSLHILVSLISTHFHDYRFVTSRGNCLCLILTSQNVWAKPQWNMDFITISKFWSTIWKKKYFCLFNNFLTQVLYFSHPKYLWSSLNKVKIFLYCFMFSTLRMLVGLSRVSGEQVRWNWLSLVCINQTEQIESKVS